MRADIEKFPTSKSAQQMLEGITKGFYDKSYLGKWLFQVMGMEYDTAKVLMEELPEQFFPETATWGLKYHEIKWGLPVRENLSYEERRNRIYQKRDFKAPMTPYRMEQYLSMATGFCVEVSDIYDAGSQGFVPVHPNEFQVVFKGEGTLDVQAAYKKLNEIRQSHTMYAVKEIVPSSLKNGGQERIFVQNLKISTKVKTDMQMRCKVVWTASMQTVQTMHSDVIIQKDFWILNGQVRLDGLRILDAKETREDLL